MSNATAHFAPQTLVHYDATTRTVQFERLQDVEPIIENNKRLQNESQRGESFRQFGAIPNVILEKWMNEHGVNLLALPEREFGLFIKRKLRDPDYAYLRTTDKRF